MRGRRDRVMPRRFRSKFANRAFASIGLGPKFSLSGGLNYLYAVEHEPGCVKHVIKRHLPSLCHAA